MMILMEPLALQNMQKILNMDIPEIARPWNEKMHEKGRGCGNSDSMCVILDVVHIRFRVAPTLVNCPKQEEPSCGERYSLSKRT
jgi:hypothetical protein